MPTIAAPTITTSVPTLLASTASRHTGHYRGEQWDSDLGLYYLRARYYNPITGRFVSRDPDDGDVTDPKTLHRYLYAGGDPINSWDPSGRSTAVAVRGSGGIEYGALIITSLQAASGAIATQIAITCAYDFLASETENWTAVGLSGGGGVEREGRARSRAARKPANGNLDSARIDDPHAFKADYVGKSNLSAWDICACSDGSISIKPVGTCGTGVPGIETHATWK